MKSYGRNKRKQVPTTLQMEAVECGAAALSMILGYHGVWVPLEKLRELCGVSRDGSKASNIVRAARSFGLEAKGFQKSPDQVMEEARYPAILHWNLNHFVVMEGKRGKKVFLNDPGCGQRTVSLDQFDKAFSGIILHFDRGENFKKQGRKPSTLMALLRRLSNYKSVVIYLAMVSFLLLVPGLVVPLFTKIFIDQILVQGMHSWGKTLLVCMGVTMAMSMLLTSLQEKCLLRFQTKLSLHETGRLLLHMLMLPVKFYSQRHPAEVSSRLSFPTTIARLLAGQIGVSFFKLILVVFYGMVMWQYSPLLTLISICAVFVNSAISEYSSVVRKRAMDGLILNQGKLMGTAMGGLMMIETIKATASENDFFSKWAGYHAKVLQGKQKLSYVSNLMAVIPGTINKFLNLTILALGSLLIINGELTIGNLIAFQLLVFSFLAPVGQLISLGPQINELTGSMNKVDDVFKYEQDSDSTRGVLDEVVDEGTEKLKGEVTLEGVRFGYNPLDKALIENFDMTVPAGKTVAFVGPSGSGKSTISALIAGLQVPQEGAIKFDMIDRKKHPRIVITSSIAMVTQRIFLFEGTIRDNLTLWDTTIEEEDLVRACKDACIHDVITSRKEGYNARVVEGGGNFSGGQRQRLEIAKALTLNPTVLILDEATSALDPIVEKRIIDNIKARGCTCVIVAHRLSTIRDAHEIIVMNGGEVVERGNHHELLKLAGVYSSLVTDI